MEITWIGTLLQLFAVISATAGYGHVQFTLVVPKLVYYDSPTVASVSAYGVESNSKASVTLEYRGKDNKVLEATQLEFTSDGSQTWEVTFPWDSHGEKSLNLVMSSGQESKNLNLAFADNFGYIFVQTDKQVYTPGQTVKYRVIAVDEQRKQAKYKVRIDVKNPQQTIIDRRTTTADEAFKPQELNLPKEASFGNWSITASFEGTDNLPRSAQTVTFEVKEFVLPRFYTELSVSPKVITKETTFVIIKGIARYYFNRSVNGTADLLLGTWDKDNGRKAVRYIAGLKLENGSFTRRVLVDNLKIDWKRLPRNTRLYVQMNITDAVNNAVDTYEDSSTFISNPTYTVEFKGSKAYFRPGFNYTLQIQLLNPNKQPASDIEITVKSEFQVWPLLPVLPDTTYEAKLDQHGRIQLNFTVPEITTHIRFSVSLPHDEESSENVFEVKKYDSANNEYISISLAAPIEKKKSGTVQLKYTKPTAADQNVGDRYDNITVLVVAKGHIVFTTSVEKKSGGTYLELPLHLYPRVSPRMRIIAYYYVPRTQEYIIDSLVADTKHACVEELTISGQGLTIYKPNTNVTLEVDGAAGMHVGLVAVDKAVFALSKAPTHTLTRNMMFTKFGSHDSGTESGDGHNMEDILKNSGLEYLSLSLKPKPHKAARYYHKDDDFRDEDTGFFHEPLMGHSRGLSYGIHRLAIDKNVDVEKDRPQTIRNDFPESWLFENLPSLPNEGFIPLERTLPSSITTWSLLAVGMSSTQEMCVSNPLELNVTKLFFADVKLPSKVKRLEKVAMEIILYNYNKYFQEIKVVVNGSAGLCFIDSSVSDGNDTHFTMTLKPNDFYSKTIQFIPMHIGKLKVTVYLLPQQEVDQDIVEKSLHVVAEGQRVKKSITFVLDPEAKNAAFKPKMSRSSATIKNVYDSENKQQNTTINLSLPVEAIKGTEVCQISAFGDLMGDIINHSVLESKSLIDATMNAEEVLGDLAPTVYALQYAQSSGLLDEKLREKSKKFVKNGVVRLLKYQLPDNSFALTPESKKPATWLTAFVLKTLCQASSLAFIDREKLINAGFLWLANQVNETNGTVDEQDWRLAKNSLEYSIMLSAEVLIAILECNKSEQRDLLHLQGAIFSFLEDNIDEIKEPIVLAKVSYAFMLSGDSHDEYTKAKRRLDAMKRKDKQDNIYWSNIEETNETKMPIWYHKSPQAYAIEATAYALIVNLNDGDTEVEAIADWLVGQRNPNGAFIGAMDSTIAIQALAKYSFQKHGMKVDLCCSVKSDMHKKYFESFKFTGENATHQRSLNNVPVGQVLDVNTKGQGLGQMQVNVEYNIPVDKNQKCPFTIIMKVTKTNDVEGDNNPLCTQCKIGCPNRPSKAVRVKVKVHKSVAMKICKGKQPPYKEGSICARLKAQKKRASGKKVKPNEVLNNKRQSRSTHEYQTYSKKSICIHICIPYRKKQPSDPVGVHIEMLTGYKPVSDDIEKIKTLPNVKHVVFDDTTETLRVQLTEVTSRKKTCLSFRAVEEKTVERLMPAVVEVIKPGTNAPMCVLDYHLPVEEENLQTYCAKNDNGDKRECKCFSGQCAKNKEYTDLHDLKLMMCESSIVYKLQFDDKNSTATCDEIDAKVIYINKAAENYSVAVGNVVKVSKPRFCACPRHRQDSSQIILFGSTVETFVDRDGNEVTRHIVDEQSTFLWYPAGNDIKLLENAKCRH
ncbi:hypothetical protein BsWGS_23146 [Bradybaena similaris]